MNYNYLVVYSHGHKQRQKGFKELTDCLVFVLNDINDIEEMAVIIDIQDNIIFDLEIVGHDRLLTSIHSELMH